MDKSLPELEIDHFKKSLFYLKMDELRKICAKLNIPHKEKKVRLIHKILFFIKTGEVEASIQIPENSKAKKNESYALNPEGYILYGNYKNDYATRDFFKSIIGKHFHFTAYGIDWINNRWREGNPPTYQEFAIFWQNEYEKRKREKAPAKKEWAYINFVQEYIKKFPDASRDSIMNAWKAERIKHLKFVEKFLIKFSKNILPKNKLLMMSNINSIILKDIQ